MVGPTESVKRTADTVLVFRHDFADAFRFHQCPLRLPNDFGANRGWHDRFVGTFKEAHVEFLFQFHEHGAERWLRNTAASAAFAKLRKRSRAMIYLSCCRFMLGRELLEAI